MIPKITIILPTYNVEKYISQCLDSLINQTFKEISILVIDDCGTDNSIKIAQSYAQKDSRIKIIRNPQNLGIANSRNVGIEHTSTPYIAFLDPDDFVEKDFYQKLYQALIDNDADISVSDVLYYYPNKNRFTREWVSLYNFQANKKLVSDPSDKQYNLYACAIWNKLYKTSLFKDNQLKYPNLKLEDVAITILTTVLAKKIVMVKEAILYYRQHSISFMKQSNKNRNPFDVFLIYEHINQELMRLLSSQEISNYSKIIDNFKIFNTYSWYQQIHQDYKDEFWDKMYHLFQTINIHDNPFLTKETIKIYAHVIKNNRPIFVDYIKLFGFIPLLKYLKTKKTIAFYLFNQIIIFRKKQPSNQQCQFKKEL